jgi:hypothetical protein
VEIQGYCLDWHENVSHSFDQFLIEPLSPFFDINLESWDGIETPNLPIIEKPSIFCQFTPPLAWLQNKKTRIIWIPMWDGIPDKPQSWWNLLPKDNLRIVAYSEIVYKKAVTAGLKTLRVKFHKNPANIETAKWEDGNVLFYWNRRGLVGPKFLGKMCSIFDIKRLIFLDHIDPLVPQSAYYSLPPKIGHTVVEEYSDTMQQSAYLELLERSNIFIAPRYLEGVGLTLIEAMAQGCAVFAKNAPTMNEYIDHKKNGYLLKRSSFPTNDLIIKIRNALIKRWHRYLLKRYSVFIPILTDHQNWSEMNCLDLAKMGNEARNSQVTGYQNWLESIQDLATFITDW